MSEKFLKILFRLKSLILLSLSLCLCSGADIKWSNHDISSLKLLQIVHRHGHRNPLTFAPNDPYQSEAKYWKEGIAELTNDGKLQMYNLGKYLRDEYNDYLGDKYSPREVYARSSASHRCIESTSSLLAGLYPPEHQDSKWGNGSDPKLSQLWQPIPIETYSPKKNDIVLRKDKTCFAVYVEKQAIHRSQEVQDFLNNKTELFEQLSPIVGETMDIKTASNLHTTLEIEMSRGLYWSHIWTKEEQQEIVGHLKDIHRFVYRMDQNSTLIKRLRGGGLVKELVKGFRSVINERNNKKVYIYSTHDSMLAILMKTLNVFDGEVPPFGATLLLELHQNPKTEEYFVRIFYIPNTINGTVVPLFQDDCGHTYDCPLNDFFGATKHLIYDNFKKECKNSIDFQKFDFEDKMFFIERNDL